MSQYVISEEADGRVFKERGRHVAGCALIVNAWQEAEYLADVVRAGREKMQDIRKVCDTYAVVDEHGEDESLTCVIPLIHLTHQVYVRQLGILKGESST